MEDSAFDQVSRAVAAPRTRRAATAWLGALLAGPLLGPDPGSAKRRKRKPRGKPCKTPQQKCGGKCRAVLTDTANCGACGNRCPVNQACKQGECTATTNPQACAPGDCCEDNQVCHGDGRCRAGVCQPKPACRANGVTFPAGQEPACCSENTASNAGTTGVEVTCLPGAIGNPCQTAGDCRSGVCVGYQCAGVCSVDNPCAGGTCCTGSGTCGACTVFVTSTFYGGNLGGLNGADTTCQQVARGAGLPGVYRAWLSSSTQGPAARFTRAIVPYILPGGQVVAGNWADLTSGRPLDHAIDHAETGADLSASRVSAWTNTTPAGLPDATTNDLQCTNWTSFGGSPTELGKVGDPFSTTNWTRSAHPQTKCFAEMRLYCFQQR